MKHKTRIEISQVVLAEHQRYNKSDLDGFVKVNMVHQLAEEIYSVAPVDVTLSSPKLGYGYSDEIHKITLFVFTEKQMEEHNEEVRKSSLLSLAANRALYSLGDRVCH